MDARRTAASCVFGLGSQFSLRGCRRCEVNVGGATLYHKSTNDLAVGVWTVSNSGSAARPASRALPGAGLMEAAPKAALFEKTMLPHLDAAYNLARWLTRNEYDAEDIVQEAYLRAFRFFDGFRGGDGRSWLLAVVRNTALTWLRREKTAPQVSFDEEVHGPRSGTVTVEAKLVEGARFAMLRNCLDLLPVEFREVVVMREMEGMSYRDIAEAASAPIGTVMSRLSRARQSLQACIAAKMKEAPK
jgi:RNA polymerase sigma-70 factor (ECF subfamily)